MPYGLPAIDAELKSAFASLKITLPGKPDEFRLPIVVRWVPSVEGKAELPEDMKDEAIHRHGLESKIKIETPKQKKGRNQQQTRPKRFLIIFGEWSAVDKNTLRSQNPEDPAKGVVEKAIRDHEAKWEAKAQSRKPHKPEDEEQEDGEDE